MFYLHNTKIEALPSGLKPELLKQIIAEFKCGNFINKNLFIESYSRLAAVISFRYGYITETLDDLVGAALLELSKFPQYVYEGKLLDDNIKRYLVSKISYACRNHLRQDKIFGPSATHIRKKGEHVKVHRLAYTTDGSPKDLYYGGNEHVARNEKVDKAFQCVDKSSDFINDLYTFVQTERERLVLTYYLSGHSNVDIASQMGWRSSTRVKTIIDTILQRYKDNLTESDDGRAPLSIIGIDL